MNLKECRVFFIVTILCLSLVVVSPLASFVIPQPNFENFSEFWMLGPNQVAEDYPLIAKNSESNRVFIGVGNQMGSSEYYLVYVKLSNSSETLPDVDMSAPSSLPPLFEYRFILDDADVWERSIDFSFEGLILQDEVLDVGYFIVNGVSFPIDLSLVWNIEKEGYYCELFFELWRYEVESSEFIFDDSFVSLRLNLIAT